MSDENSNNSDHKSNMEYDFRDEASDGDDAFSEDHADGYDASHDADYYEHDDRHQPLASRVLTWIAVLFAGGALALWGGPKLAPNLPEFAQPIAKYLTPGANSVTQEISSLRGEINMIATKVDGIPTAPDEGAITAIVSRELGATQTEMNQQLVAVQDTLSAIDGTDIETRLAQVETRLEGVAAEISALTNSVQAVSAEGGSLSEEALAQITSKSAEVEGLRAEIGEMSGMVGKLTQRIDDVEAAATRRVEEARAEAEQAEENAQKVASMAAYQSAVDALADKARDGSAYSSELADLASQGVEIPEVLAANADVGIASTAALKSEFSETSHIVIRQSIKERAEENGGTASRVGAFFKSQVAARSLEPKEGDSADAILSRMDAALQSGQLNAVLDEAKGLTERARAPLQDWLTKIETRNAVEDALTSLAGQPS